MDAPLRFSGDVETCFSLTQTYAFIRTKDVAGIYTQTSTRDQSRDRILLQGSLTRRYAEIEESALYMQNAYMLYSKMQAKVGEVKSTHCLCASVIHLSWLYKCRTSLIFVYTSIKISSNINIVMYPRKLIIAYSNTVLYYMRVLTVLFMNDISRCIMKKYNMS